MARHVVGDVLEDLRGDDPVEGAVGEGEVQGVALHGAGPGPRLVQLARLHHGPEGGPHPGHLVGPGVEGEHRRPAPDRLEGVATEAAAEVQDEVAGPHPQALVVDGQHRVDPVAPDSAVTVGAAPAPGAAGAPGSGRPSIRAW